MTRQGVVIQTFNSNTGGRGKWDSMNWSETLSKREKQRGGVRYTF